MPIIKKKNIWKKSSLQIMEWPDFFPSAREDAEKEEIAPLRMEPAPAEKKEEPEEPPAVQGQNVSEANDQARQIVEQARAQSEKIKDDAYQKGSAEAVAEAERKAEEKYSALFKNEVVKIAQIARALESSYGDIVQKAEASLVKLALDVARKVIREECSEKESVVLTMVREGLSRVGDKLAVRVRVNPQQMPAVKKNREVFAAETEGIKDLEFIADSNISPGGCVIETDSGSLDLRIEKQFSEIKASLTGEEDESNETV